MFGWGKKEEKKPANPRRKADLSKLGLFDIPDDFGQIGVDSGGDSDNDADLEAELAALTTGSAARKPKKKPAPGVNLDAMVAASMRDIPSDEEVDSADENDPDLLAELGELVPEAEEAEEEPQPVAPPRKSSQPAAPAAPTPSSSGGLVGLLEERIEMYKKAENSAKQAGESSRARRFNRGLKTLTDQLKQAKAGRPVPEEEIPPVVSAAASIKPPETPVPPVEVPQNPSETPPPTQEPLIPIRAAPPVPPNRVAPAAPLPAPIQEVKEDKTLIELQQRQMLFKQAALTAKKSGDMEQAVKYLKVSKQFDSVIAAVKSGNPVDLSEMPEAPSSSPPAAATPVSRPAPPVPTTPKPTEAEVQSSSEGAEPEVLPEPLANPKAPSLPPELLDPPAPTSVADALNQRLARYQAEEKLAKDTGNSSKARRMGRIVKQYQDAVKMHKAGKPIPVEDLPTPPGFAPIPVPGAAAPASPPVAMVEPAEEPTEAPLEEPQPPAKVSKPPRPDATPTAAAKLQVPARKSPQQTRQEKQINLLLAKQKEFKEAALAAKKRGDISEARELLRQAKGFDALLQASESGLPVDLDTLPVLPSLTASLDADFEYVTPPANCTGDEASEIYVKIEDDLKKQMKLCLATRDHYKATGDVAGANKFEQLAVQTKRDYNMVKACHLRGETLPRFRYENRAFQILQCNTDLGENDLELVIVQGISYTVPNPKEIDTYVKYEFPYPTETPPKDKTALIYNTNNPQYNHSFTLPISRSSRPCQRVFKRHAIKLEVWSKGGFLRSDTLIGTVNVKLLPLETKCTIHETFPLMDGRKAVGGQLEVKVRLRHPIVARQVEQRQERWIVVAPNDK
ncbi:coiled-coil and C2 domain-containing protein 1-like isoform X2 [Neocloeon triangulifer]|uniref:coiled-coil and C2 domain-containing protein 1-like isoform X2 n=1 Tax=Neocloeon triangulifer TaxID=2078957 RepID=UPI00286F3FBD|nr:coiled-coil and C2 domain-containing protein 1-like isoform X2 [Neocloeon triangulifer]